MTTTPALTAAAGRITVEKQDDAWVLRLIGEIDDATIAAYEGDLATSDTSGVPTISVVDLAEVTYFCSAGVSLLLRQTRETRDQGHRPTLRGLANPARRVLHLTGVTGLFHADA